MDNLTRSRLDFITHMLEKTPCMYRNMMKHPDGTTWVSIECEQPSVQATIQQNPDGSAGKTVAYCARHCS